MNWILFPEKERRNTHQKSSKIPERRTRRGVEEIDQNRREYFGKTNLQRNKHINL